ncbi:putative Acetyltransferase [Tenacibaculum litopenaei]|uniref:PglD-related sugar-binding protein n=1 Tax=Tenacibaculum litopenaei TaxID=396016 RepID=UPI0038958C56
MKKIAIIGTGGLGREVLAMIKSINEYDKKWEIVGFYDDAVIAGTKVAGYQVVGSVALLNEKKESLNVVIGVGNPVIRKLIRNKISNRNINFPVIIHPSSVIYDKKSVQLEEGVVIAANCVLTTDIKVGRCTYINSASVVSHDSVIGAFCMLMPTTSLSTGVVLGNEVYLGNGTKIDEPIHIEEGMRIKAGSILP